jgi:hypothetical protein
LALATFVHEVAGGDEEATLAATSEAAVNDAAVTPMIATRPVRDNDMGVLSRIASVSPATVAIEAEPSMDVATISGVFSPNTAVPLGACWEDCPVAPRT